MLIRRKLPLYFSLAACICLGIGSIAYIHTLATTTNSLESAVQTQHTLADTLTQLGIKTERTAIDIPEWNVLEAQARLEETHNDNTTWQSQLKSSTKTSHQKLQNALTRLEEMADVATELDQKAPKKCQTCDSVADDDTLQYANNLIDAHAEIDIHMRTLHRSISTALDTLAQQNTIQNPLWGKTDSELQAQIQNMTLKEKAGQMLMFGFSGGAVTDELHTNLQIWEAGGVILMRSNIGGAQQVQNLITQIQTTNPDIPYFVSVDQEGGAVSRVTWDTVPGQSNWGQTDPSTLCTYGANRARLLHSLGFNLNFSPVADVSYQGEAFINNRTISDNPDSVSEAIQPYIACHQRKGVFTTIKHWPGHGSTTEDSHFVLPTISKSETEWRKQDLPPFQQNLEAEFVMAGHLVYSAIDEKPATQSEILLTEILRKELEFDGLIITDDMNQLHVSTEIGVREALKNAYTAGVDIVLYVGLPMSQAEIKNELVSLLETGEVPMETVDEIILRILRVKRRIGLQKT